MARKRAKSTLQVQKYPRLIVNNVKQGYKRLVVLSEKRPLFTFFIFLGIIILLIVASNTFFSLKKEQTKESKSIKEVSIYRIGAAPKIKVSAQTKKSGVIQITALSGGVINRINVKEGDVIGSGSTLIEMSSNYEGDNALSVQRQITERQYQANASTYKTQREIIDRQKEIARKNLENDEEMRKIIEQSISETRDLISQNEEILNVLGDEIKNLEQNNAPASQVLPLKEQRSQFLASTNQAKTALRTNEYNASSDNPPAEIAELNKEVTLRQLSVQEKQLTLSLEVSRLQTRVAQINESLMYPKAPFAGTVERIYVKEKQQVTPGTPLLVFSQTQADDPVTAVAFVSSEIARKVSMLEPSTLHIGNKAIFQSIPSFITTEAVQGTLYAVYYPIPQEYYNLVVSEGYITVDIPIGYPDTSMVATYIPIDSVYQTEGNSYVFVVSNNKAEARNIQLGPVYGEYVEVFSGLRNQDAVILNRNIIQGDAVIIK